MPPLLIALAWKSALLCVVALGGAWAMRRRPAAERVALLRVALAALLALPLLTLALPAAEVPLLPAPQAVAPTEMATSLPQQKATITLRIPPAERSPEPAALLWLLYLGGAALMLAHLAVGIATLAHWTRRGQPVADRQWLAALQRAGKGRRAVRLLVSPHASTPLSWGIAPAWILIDPETAARPEQAESVIAHEIAHIRRFDWLALVAAHLTVALYWFNPLVWMLRQRLMREAELAADSDAVREIACADYAQVLLSVAARPAGPRIANGMALAQGTLPHRIATLLEGGAHRRANRALSVALLVGGLGVAAPLAAMKLVPAASPAGPEASLRTVSIAPALAAPFKVEGNRERGEAARESVPGREKPPVQAPPVAPPPAPTPQPSASQPGAVILSKSDKLVIAVPVQQQVTIANPQEEGRGSAVEGQRQGAASRGEAIGNLMESAAELREQAMDLEESADEDGLTASARDGHRRAAQSLRNQAAKLESEAKAMLGAP
ncbi:M56 family metallopeptidase [Sphingomonas sp. JC676]|uniref:M56 family metallopeptidase n=1 Tax=Sphingomonas sp. JC676 TaxID=2768065 RepID=UPI0016576FE0|nr:M56 family metallopeptidase [Sphingomonas sp. JC676]MBC9033181.1 M56 family metallopeptidase [Sphingomonas sp. JC676]